jgi:AP-2 complex subunit alpha
LFIGDIRNCSNKEQEEKVVYKEMAKVRARFLKGGLSAYDRKKYVWKLIYAHILGYDVDFGHDVAVSLINCHKFGDKVTGYIAIGIMMDEQTDADLFINCM